ncbi:MAG: IS21 family transposase [Elusimicrobiota bacterium]
MAHERVSMRKIKEILRLKYENQLSIRQIANSVKTSRATVTDYLKRAVTSGISWAKDKNLSDIELEDKLFFSYDSAVVKRDKQERRHEADWLYIHNELKRPNVTLSLLWEEYKAMNPDGYQYSYFNELYCNWKEKLNVSMRQDHKAGEKLFVDYGEGLNIIDRSTGEVVPVQMFIGVWGASNYTYAEAGLSQSSREWLMAHVRAFEYFKCVPRILVPDNLKSGVTKACKYEPEINAAYLDIASHYGFAVIPARPYRPKDKAKVEVGVLIAKRWIMASLRDRKFFSLSELNEAIKELLLKLNTRKMKKLGKSRQEMFDDLDKPAAFALNDRRYEYAVWKKCRVNIDYHIEADSHYYSVPYQIVKEEVDVRLTDNIVEIFYRGKRQASHVRSFDKHRHTTLKEHMPQSHQKYLDWSPSRILSWAEKTGPFTKEMVKIILETRKFPEQGYRSCLGILRLTSHYTAERMENACKRAITYHSYSFKSVKMILENNLDKQADLFAGVKDSGIVLPAHENVRGKDYYDADNKPPNDDKLLN